MTAGSRVLVVAITGLVAARAAHAQSATAEALFREGRTLLKQGNVEAGCDKLEASERLESSVGTLLNLGDCREKLGKAASAWAAFRKAEALAKLTDKDGKRQHEAKRRAQRLEADLASITVQVGPAAKNDGLVITRDGEVIAPELWGTAIVVEPGSHTVIAEAPGFQRWQSDISVGRGGNRWVVVPTLERIPEPAPAPIAVTPAPAPPPQQKQQKQQQQPRIAVASRPAASRTVTVQPTWSTSRGIAVTVGVLGLGALGAGGFFASRAGDLQSQSNEICPTTTCDDPEGLRLNDRAQDRALRANVLFAAGGVAVVAAMITWLVGKPDETTVIAPTVSESHVGAALTRRF